MPAVWNPQANALFLEVLKQPPDKREAFLAQGCRENLVLAEQVRALLAASDRAGDFLESPHTVVANLADTAREIEAESPGLEFLAPSQRPDSLGRLGHYEILEIVGSGGFGVVLKAFDEHLHRIVAIKILNQSLAASAIARRRFVREARAAAAINHENVVNIYAVEESGPVPYLVMEYVGGVSLEEKLKQGGPPGVKEILRIGMQIAAGLAAAHKQGLVHRDVKPANILLENSVERVKITDFGLARTANDAELTQTGLIAGTPSFMSPEQANGESVDFRSDLFSLGSVLYAICTGRAPFRGETSLGVLRQVCDESPRPLRDLNPDVPDWLAAIVAKLHSKNLSDRYQSAAEVADLLNHHLAQLQQPGLPASQVTAVPQSQFSNPKSKIRARHWALAATAVLVLLACALALTEAGGVTNLATTVVRILTPDGTLIVETKEPGVKVTVEGDGGLKFEGAGLDVFHLRPGSYKVRADKNGQPVPLERELVSIATAGREVIKVKLESPPATAAAKTEPGAFVVLGGKGVAERKFDSLFDAILGANDGDAIEIRGNGPFVSEPITIRRQALTISAGEGFRPVIRLENEHARTDGYLLQTDSRLVLEGLEFQRIDDGKHQDPTQASFLLKASGDVLHVANCCFRLISADDHFCNQVLLAAHSRRSCVRNCELLSPTGVAIDLSVGADEKSHLLDNNVIAGRQTLMSWRCESKPTRDDVQIRLMRNTIMSEACTSLHIDTSPAANLSQKVEGGRLIPVQAVGNVFDAGWFLWIGHSLEPKDQLDAEQSFKRVIGWSDQDNLYDVEYGFFYSSDGRDLKVHGPRSLAEWKEFWAHRDGSVTEGPIRYEGGNLSVKLLSACDKITSNDFRLRADSAGHRAGPNGKDLGADVDLVGPGPAYERWKKTPAYLEWLKETGQLEKRAAAKPESGAFVVQGGAGVAERRFDTLAGAVQAASNGDTIEIRGNGPFPIETVRIQDRALTIRAAEGYRPILRLNKDMAKGPDLLVATNAPLVVEGLEFQRDAPRDPKAQGPKDTAAIRVSGGPLHVANCRFVQPKSNCIRIDDSVRQCFLTNCEFPDSWCALSGVLGPESRWVINNSVLTGSGFIDSILSPPNQASIRVTRTSLAGAHHAFYFDISESSRPATPNTKPAARAAQLETSRNVLDVFTALFTVHKESLDPGDTEEVLPHLFDWRGRDNVYDVKAPALDENAGFLATSSQTGRQNPWHGPKHLADWARFWGSTEPGSLEGRVRYQGGDLATRAATAPDKFTPEDFRLRPDSAGYRAGTDGKDLGADVDLVGPGPAYERWKKTPAYQEWLLVTGQLETRAAAKPESGEFVVQGGAGVAERRFDTLAAAVQAASDGDTIEVRGNGPFVSEPIDIQRTALTIRAAEGFRPVIKLSPEASRQKGTFLATNAALVLEGLELHRAPPEDWASGELSAVGTNEAPLWAANCRFRAPIWAKHSPVCVLRNCEFLTEKGGSAGARFRTGGKLVLENCLHRATAFPIGFEFEDAAVNDASIQIKRNSFASQGASLRLVLRNPSSVSSGPSQESKAILIDITECIFDAPDALGFEQTRQFLDKATALEPAEAEAILVRLLQWRGERNLFSAGSTSVSWSADSKPQPPHGPKNLEEWKQFWGTAEPASLPGTIRFQGGNLRSLTGSAIDQLTPDDFRLRADSAGYRAGPDGKDLGADVNLVGPGAAYERWKQSPEYQDWLKETGQMK